MAISVGTNDLRIYRRHASYCTRYPSLKNKPDTYRPTTKKNEKADTCDCPIWCRGYLAKETKIVKGKLRAKRAFASLDTNDWTAAKFYALSRQIGFAYRWIRLTHHEARLRTQQLRHSKQALHEPLLHMCLGNPRASLQ